jgi:hypothetical protein
MENEKLCTVLDFIVCNDFPLINNHNIYLKILALANTYLLMNF